MTHYLKVMGLNLTLNLLILIELFLIFSLLAAFRTFVYVWSESYVKSFWTEFRFESHSDPKTTMNSHIITSAGYDGLPNEKSAE